MERLGSHFCARPCWLMCTVLYCGREVGVLMRVVYACSTSLISASSLLGECYASERAEGRQVMANMDEEENDVEGYIMQYLCEAVSLSCTSCSRS